MELKSLEFGAYILSVPGQIRSANNDADNINYSNFFPPLVSGTHKFEY